MCARSLQPCPTLCHLMDCSQPGSSVCGILQARILEWVSKPSSRGSSRPRNQTPVSCIDRQILHHYHHLGSLTPGPRPHVDSLVAWSVKNLLAMQETPVQFLGWEDPLVKEMATHSSIIAWRILWTEKPVRLQSMGLQESDIT